MYLLQSTLIFAIVAITAQHIFAENVPDLVSENGALLISLGRVGSKLFYVGEQMKPWEAAGNECREFGMRLVTIDTEDEYDFIIRAGSEGKGPFWFGARDIGDISMYRWHDTPGYGGPDYPRIGDFVRFSQQHEQGPLALIMNMQSIGSSLFAVHSHLPAAKPFCQYILKSE